MTGPWDVFEDRWHVNPVLHVPSWCWTMVRLWRLSLGQGGMGAGHLPEGPAAMSQSPAMMEAFAVMTAAENELSQEKRPGVWTRRDIADVRASIAAANALYPDGPATGAVLEALRKLDAP